MANVLLCVGERGSPREIRLQCERAETGQKEGQAQQCMVKRATVSPESTATHAKPILETENTFVSKNLNS